MVGKRHCIFSVLLKIFNVAGTLRTLDLSGVSSLSPEKYVSWSLCAIRPTIPEIGPYENSPSMHRPFVYSELSLMR
jgi:hypothetical protein